MSSSTPSTASHSDAPAETSWRLKMTDILQWLQSEWYSLYRQYNANALNSVRELMDKAPALLTKLDELVDLKQQDLIQQHEDQWRQALETPATEKPYEAQGWRNKLNDIVSTTSELVNIIDREYSTDNKRMVGQLIRTGPELLKALDQLKSLQQERLAEIEKCKSDWNEAISKRKGELAELDEIVANKQPAVEAAQRATEAAKNETKDKLSELHRVKAAISRETTSLTSLLHQRLDADKSLKETQENAKKEKICIGEERAVLEVKTAEMNTQIAEREDVLNRRQQSLDDRDRECSERERNFQTTVDEAEGARILAKQQLADTHTEVTKYENEVKGRDSRTKRRWTMLSDYQELKNGQVARAEENASNLKAIVDRNEEEMTVLRNLVSQQKSELEGMKKSLASESQSLGSMTKLKDQIAKQSDFQKHQLQDSAKVDSALQNLSKQLQADEDRRAAKVQSQLDAFQKHNEQLQAEKENLSRKVTTLETSVKEKEIGLKAVQSLQSETSANFKMLNGSMKQMLAAQANLEESASAKAALIAKVKQFEEVVIPELEGKLDLARGDLEKAKETCSDAEILREQLKDFQEKLASKEKELDDNRSAGVIIMSNPDDAAALEKCKSDHSDIDELRADNKRIKGENAELRLKSGMDDEVKQTFEQKVASLQTELDKVREELSRTKDELNQTESAAGEQGKSRAQEIEDLRTQNQAFQLKSVEAQRHREDADKKLKDAERLLRDRNSELQTARKEVEANGNNVTDLKRAEALLKEQIGSLHIRLNSANKRIGPQTSNENRDLKEKYNDLKVAHEDATNSLGHAREAHENAIRELGSVKSKLDSSIRVNCDLVQQRKRLTQRLQSCYCSNTAESRKRTHDQMLSSDDENQDDLNTGSSGQPTHGPQLTSAAGRPFEPPMDQPSTSPPYVYEVAKVWTDEFNKDGRIPVTVVKRLRDQMKRWKKSKASWMTSDARRCADTFTRKKASVWDEKFACETCADKGQICVAIQKGTIELLPLKEAGDVNADDERFWFKRI